MPGVFFLLTKNLTQFFLAIFLFCCWWLPGRWAPGSLVQSRSHRRDVAEVESNDNFSH